MTTKNKTLIIIFMLVQEVIHNIVYIYTIYSNSKTVIECIIIASRDNILRGTGCSIGNFCHMLMNVDITTVQ